MDPISLAIMGGMTLLGGVFGGIDTWWKGEQEKARIKHQKDMAWKQYELGRDYANEQWDLQKDKALDDLALAENRLDQGVDMQIDAFNNSLLAQAYQVQDAQIQMESQIGQMEAASGYSGVKGNETNGLLAAYAESGLDHSIEMQNRNNDTSLTGMLDQASNAWGDIIREEESWGPDGYRTRQKEAQDAYNRDMAELGQTNFNWAIEQYNPENMIPDYFTGAMVGASTGLSFGANFYDFGSNFLGGGGSSPADYMKGYRFAPGAR